MAQITPNDILRLSEPVEKKYIDVSNKIMLNIASHFATGKQLPIVEWQRKKISESEKLTAENARIIAQGLKDVDDDLNAAYSETAEMATDDFDKQAQQAVKENKIPFVPSIGESLVMAALLKNISASTKQRLGNVDKTMLTFSTLQYQQAISNTVLFEANLAAQGYTILEAGTKDIAAGIATRTQALRKALRALADNGITGFVDRAGRTWTPEAYTNMVMRTSIHNTSIEAVKGRQEEYGSKVFMYSAHSSARPLCFPLQNRFFTWGTDIGTITDGNGNRHHYTPFDKVDGYGTGAGPLGCNCQHYPIPVIPKVTIPHKMEAQDDTENKKTYDESQKQRQIERSIRDAKRRQEMANSAGDKVGAQQAETLVKQRQAAMRGFINETGRTRRYDREQI